MIEQIKNGDTKPLVELYILYQEEFIVWSVSKFGIPEEEAKDIFQDTIVAFYNNIISGKLTELSSNVKTYLFAIGKFTIYNYLKKNSNRGNILPLEFIKDENSIAMAEIENDDELQELIAALIEKLPEKDKEILKKYYFERKSFKEIANEMGYASEEVARKKKHFSLKKLIDEVKSKITLLVF